MVCRFVLTVVFSAAAIAQVAPPAPSADPVVGNWRGTLTSASGTESPIIITIVKKGDGYAGSTNGLNASSESALKRVDVNGTRVTVEGTDDSKLGTVSLTADLTAEGNRLTGTGTVSVGAQKLIVTLALQRRPRADTVPGTAPGCCSAPCGRWRATAEPRSSP